MIEQSIPSVCRQANRSSLQGTSHDAITRTSSDAADASNLVRTHAEKR